MLVEFENHESEMELVHSPTPESEPTDVPQLTLVESPYSEARSMVTERSEVDTWDRPYASRSWNATSTSVRS